MSEERLNEEQGQPHVMVDVLVGKLSPKAGDLLWIKVPRTMTPAEAHTFRHEMGQYLPKGVQVLTTGEDFNFCLVDREHRQEMHGLIHDFDEDDRNAGILYTEAQIRQAVEDAGYGEGAWSLVRCFLRKPMAVAMQETPQERLGLKHPDDCPACEGEDPENCGLCDDTGKA